MRRKKKKAVFFLRFEPEHDFYFKSEVRAKDQKQIRQISNHKEKAKARVYEIPRKTLSLSLCFSTSVYHTERYHTHRDTHTLALVDN